MFVDVMLVVVSYIVWIQNVLGSIMPKLEVVDIHD